MRAKVWRHENIYIHCHTLSLYIPSHWYYFTANRRGQNCKSSTIVSGKNEGKLCHKRDHFYWPSSVDTLWSEESVAYSMKMTALSSRTNKGWWQGLYIHGQALTRVHPKQWSYNQSHKTYKHRDKDSAHAHTNTDRRVTSHINTHTGLVVPLPPFSSSRPNSPASPALTLDEGEGMRGLRPKR